MPRSRTRGKSRKVPAKSSRKDVLAQCSICLKNNVRSTVTATNSPTGKKSRNVKKGWEVAWSADCAESVCKLLDLQLESFKDYLVSGLQCSSCKELLYDVDFTIRTGNGLNKRRTRLKLKMAKLLYHTIQSWQPEDAIKVESESESGSNEDRLYPIIASESESTWTRSALGIYGWARESSPTTSIRNQSEDDQLQVSRTSTFKTWNFNSIDDPSDPSLPNLLSPDSLSSSKCKDPLQSPSRSQRSNSATTDHLYTQLIELRNNEVEACGKQLESGNSISCAICFNKKSIPNLSQNLVISNEPSLSPSRLLFPLAIEMAAQLEHLEAGLSQSDICHQCLSVSIDPEQLPLTPEAKMYQFLEPLHRLETRVTRLRKTLENVLIAELKKEPENTANVDVAANAVVSETQNDVIKIGSIHIDDDKAELIVPSKIVDTAQIEIIDFSDFPDTDADDGVEYTNITSPHDETNDNDVEEKKNSTVFEFIEAPAPALKVGPLSRSSKSPQVHQNSNVNQTTYEKLLPSAIKVTRHLLPSKVRIEVIQVGAENRPSNSAKAGVFKGQKELITVYKPSEDSIPDKGQAGSAVFQCTVCSEVQCNKTSLKRHMKLTHPSTKTKPFQCNVCNMIFRHQSALSRHRKYQHRPPGSEPIVKAVKVKRPKPEGSDSEESSRKKQFWASRKRKAQKQQEKDPSALQCDICFRILSCPQGLKNHKWIHTNEKPYECKLCSRKFRHRSQLYMHKKRHDTTRRYTCPFEGCPRLFVCKYQQKVHEATHIKKSERVRDWPCHQCSKEFVSKAHLEMHKKRMHPDPEKYRAENLPRCTVCGKTYMSEREVKVHMANQHDPDSKEYVCEICANRYATSTALSRHQILVHEKIPGVEQPRDHECSQCDKKFSTGVALRRHAETHQSVRSTVQCQICYKTLKVGSLRVHMKRHAGISRKRRGRPSKAKLPNVTKVENYYVETCDFDSDDMGYGERGNGLIY